MKKSIYELALEEIDKQKQEAQKLDETLKDLALLRKQNRRPGFNGRGRRLERRPSSMPPNSSWHGIYLDGGGARMRNVQID